MFQLIGYNFFGDGDALNFAPSSVENINRTEIAGAIFNHFNVTRDVNLPFTTEIPNWTYDTIMDANFNGNLNAGNVDFLIEQISSIKIKRRKTGEFDWITLTEIPINSVEDLSFTFNDILNANNEDYDYALVPTLNNVEGNYIINNVFSEFNGVFIGDADSIYKFMYEVDYGSNSRAQQIGTFEPIGNKYPIVVANGDLSYNTGTISATLLNDEFENTGVVDRQAIVQKKELLKTFLTNKKAKILKDWNGNIWLCIVTSSPQFDYKSGSGMGIPQVTFSWTEIGDAESQEDLYANGLVSVPE